MQDFNQIYEAVKNFKQIDKQLKFFKLSFIILI